MFAISKFRKIESLIYVHVSYRMIVFPQAGCISHSVLLSLHKVILCILDTLEYKSISL